MMCHMELHMLRIHCIHFYYAYVFYGRRQSITYLQNLMKHPTFLKKFAFYIYIDGTKCFNFIIRTMRYYEFYPERMVGTICIISKQGGTELNVMTLFTSLHFLT